MIDLDLLYCDINELKFSLRYMCRQCFYVQFEHNNGIADSCEICGGRCVGVSSDMDDIVRLFIQRGFTVHYARTLDVYLRNVNDAKIFHSLPKIFRADRKVGSNCVIELKHAIQADTERELEMLTDDALTALHDWIMSIDDDMIAVWRLAGLIDY